MRISISQVRELFELKVCMVGFTAITLGLGPSSSPQTCLLGKSDPWLCFLLSDLLFLKLEPWKSPSPSPAVNGTVWSL